MSWSEGAWSAVAPWYDAVLAHPFVAALSDGTLDGDVFARYLLDDAHYLLGYARALAGIASRAPDATGVALFAGAAAGAVEAERGLHRGFPKPLGLDPDAPGAAEPSPTCDAYVGWLQAQATSAPVEVAVASVLPCFRVYAEVGAAIAARGTGPDHPYRSWIETYADDDFDAAVRAASQYADGLAAATTPPRREDMTAAYVRATRFELMFWDSAWRGEAWPVVAP
ncbi:TenA family protein [Solicola sp. PLA-1-18]|uniref:TenA family protein n=1 Tax=Solicola sp. PLA-1-18 TaxID=3380532 RepID=UPI003B7AC0A5